MLGFFGSGMLALLSPIFLLLLGLVYSRRSPLLGFTIALYALPAIIGVCFLVGPMIRFFKRIHAGGSDEQFALVTERWGAAKALWSDAPPQMGLVANTIYWVCSTLYFIFYLPILFLTMVWVLRYVPERFHRNHFFSWFVLFVVVAYGLIHAGHLRAGAALACDLVVVAVTAVFLLLKVHKGSILLYSYPRFQMRLSIIGETATSIVLAFGVLHYEVSMSGNQAYSSALTIPDSLYFSAVTFATVGYGDIYPRSLLAKAACTAEICSGILVLIVAVAVTTSIWLQKHQPAEKIEKSQAQTVSTE